MVISNHEIMMKMVTGKQEDVKNVERPERGERGKQYNALAGLDSLLRSE